MRVLGIPHLSPKHAIAREQLSRPFNLVMNKISVRNAACNERFGVLNSWILGLLPVATV